MSHELVTARLDHTSSANIFQIDDLLFNLDLWYMLSFGFYPLGCVLPTDASSLALGLLRTAIVPVIVAKQKPFSFHAPFLVRSKG